ncbi:hypothetical protein ACHWQZ_G013826 [Mnemiopsis leidyi]
MFSDVLTVKTLAVRIYDNLLDKAYSRGCRTNMSKDNMFKLAEGLFSSTQTFSFLGTIISSSERPTNAEDKKQLVDDIISYLEKRDRIDTEETGTYNETLAHAAARLDLPELSKYLIDNHAEVIESKDDFGQSPWHMAAMFGSIGVMKEHSEAGHEITSRADFTLWSILHYAALKGHKDVIRYILDNEIMPVDHKDRYGRTPLFLAIQYEMRESAYLLLEYGADQTEQSKLKITPLGLSAYFMPELTIPFLNEIKKCSVLGQEDENIPAETFLQFSQSSDLSIILVSPNCNDIIVHPVVNGLIKSVYFKNMKGLVAFVFWFIFDILSISYLCMEENTDIALLTEDDSKLVNLVFVIMSLVWIAVCATYKLIKYIAIIKFSYTTNQNDVSGKLIECAKNCTNARLKKDNHKYILFYKELKCKRIDRLIAETFWIICGTIGRVSVFGLSFIEGISDDSKHYVTFIATLVVFMDIVLHDGNDICFVPNSVMITLLSVKHALSSFVKSLFTILMLSMPYYLITLKFTYKEKHYFTNIEGKQRPDGQVEILPAMGWSILYLFKVMLTDDYQVEDFNEKHREFFLVYHIFIVFMLSLVVMNLLIAQTSQTYEDFVDNSKAEILKHRIFTIILFGMYSRFERSLDNEKDITSSNI